MTTRLPSILSQLSFPAYVGRTGLKIGVAQGSVEKNPKQETLSQCVCAHVHVCFCLSSCTKATNSHDSCSKSITALLAFRCLNVLGFLGVMMAGGGAKARMCICVCVWSSLFAVYPCERVSPPPIPF